jgi:metacaspase-1
MSNQEILLKNQSKLLDFIKQVKTTKLPLTTKQTLIQNKIIGYNKIRDYVFGTIPASSMPASSMPASSMPVSNKYALLIGINYTGTYRQLDGCINDVNNIKAKLLSNFGFKEENIICITDDTPIQPTKVNLIEQLTQFVKKANKGDSLFLSYSGHGTHTTDSSTDIAEVSGQEQLIVPIDAVSIDGCIQDDTLNSILRSEMKDGVNMFGLIDSCYSGTIFDLKYGYMIDTGTRGVTTFDNKFSVFNNVNITSINKGKVFVLSGCKDDQKSADASVKDGSSILYTGAMTYTFLKSIDKLGEQASLQNILTNIRDMLKQNNFTQTPQLSSDNFADISAVQLKDYLDNKN